MTATIRRALFRASAVLVLAVAFAGTAYAQAQVRVVKDGAIVWRRDARLPATTLKVGTVLDVLGREGLWYVVVIPPESGGRGQTGLIAVGQVEPVPGSGPIPVSPPGETSRPAGGTPARATAGPRRAVEVLGFGQAGYTAWLARDTFKAVLGASTGPIFGGGAQVRFKAGPFVEAAAEWFQKSGERVFVSGGEVFKLGIRDTVRVVPVSVTAGYRYQLRKAAVYAGGGLGRYLYRETSDFADAAENIDETFSSYHAVAGVEFSDSRWLRTAFEVQFTTVPDALGTTGASAAFAENNLGGFQLRIKILAGR